jgi:predicted NAD/FAD-binding protein
MKHVAVIGSGIAGLAAAYFLSRTHRVTLFEKADRLGGHTHTVRVDDESGPLSLDLGFLVHNDRTYPNLVRLFAELWVETAASDMSFAVACPASGFEYSSRGLRGFFADRRRLASPAHFRLLRDIVRFNREAPRVLTEDAGTSWTRGEFVRDGNYSDAFVFRYLMPMASAVWSASIDTVDRFPVRTLVQFMANHGMLSIASHPRWRVVRHGSSSYIPPLVKPIDTVCAGVTIQSVRRGEAGVTISFADRPAARADEVVFACHGDQVLPMLADPSDAEREVFSAFTTTANEVWLHTETAALPRRRWARASWNYRLEDDEAAPPSVTYHLNRLQNLTCSTDYCVTLNPRWSLPRERVITRVSWRHPRVTVDSLRAQQRWREVSGTRRTHYCGAYWRYGFHEDGLLSALRVAADLGVRW